MLHILVDLCCRSLYFYFPLDFWSLSACLPACLPTLLPHLPPLTPLISRRRCRNERLSSRSSRGTLTPPALALLCLMEQNLPPHRAAELLSRTAGDALHPCRAALEWRWEWQEGERAGRSGSFCHGVIKAVEGRARRAGGPGQPAKPARQRSTFPGERSPGREGWSWATAHRIRMVHLAADELFTQPQALTGRWKKLEQRPGHFMYANLLSLGVTAESYSPSLQWCDHDMGNSPSLLCLTIDNSQPLVCFTVPYSILAQSAVTSTYAVISHLAMITDSWLLYLMIRYWRSWSTISEYMANSLGG